MDELRTLSTNLARNATLFSLFELLDPLVHTIFDQKPDELLNQMIVELRKIEGFENIDRTHQVEQVATEFFDDIAESFSPENSQRLAFEMILCRNVEELDRYLSQMLRKAFLKRPKILLASENTIQLSEVLQCSSIEEVILRVAERKVQTLGRMGFKDIIKYLNDKLKIDFNAQMPEFLAVSEMFQVRNIIVHNSGIINEVFLQNTKRRDLEIGQLFPLTKEYVARGGVKLLSIGNELNQRFKLHFKFS